MKKIFIFPLISILFFSCSSDEVKSFQNYIESFSYPGISPVQVNIVNDQNTVNVLTNQDVAGIEPAIVVSAGASWKRDGEKYIVTAENGDTRSYTVIISKTVPSLNSFENWTSDKGYYVYSDLNWTSGNAAISIILKDRSNPESYPTKKTENGYVGNAVVLETIEGSSVFGRDMPLLSGNFFLGNFNTQKMVTDELAATEFGKLYLVKPKSVKGYYKYEEGPGPGSDFCDIYAAFYQASDDNGNEIILTAHDNLDEKSLAYARVPNCTTTDGFLPFELNFNNYKGEPDFAKYRYKLVITFASSSGGATFEGKIGSKLTVDEVVID